MDAKKRVLQNQSNPQEPAFTELQLARYYNLSVISIKVIFERAEAGNTECAKALQRIAVALLNMTGRIVAREGYEETYEEEIENV